MAASPAARSDPGTSRTARTRATRVAVRLRIHLSRSVSIAAASILAKVERDQHLERLDRKYPQYCLAQNKGYGTPEHLDALARYGPCPEHRRTYQPVKDVLIPRLPFGSA